LVGVQRGGFGADWALVCNALHVVVRSGLRLRRAALGAGAAGHTPRGPALAHVGLSAAERTTHSQSLAEKLASHGGPGLFARGPPCFCLLLLLTGGPSKNPVAQAMSCRPATQLNGPAAPWSLRNALTSRFQARIVASVRIDVVAVVTLFRGLHHAVTAHRYYWSTSAGITVAF
jgi:hypothetical protein